MTTQEFMYWDHSSKTYRPVPSQDSQQSKEGDHKEEKKQKAKNIAKVGNELVLSYLNRYPVSLHNVVRIRGSFRKDARFILFLSILIDCRMGNKCLFQTYIVMLFESIHINK